MKTLRGLYVITLGVIGIPWFALFVACLYVWGLIVAVKEKDIELVKATHKGVKEGTHMGVTNFKLFVKYGRSYGIDEFIEEL